MISSKLTSMMRGGMRRLAVCSDALGYLTECISGEVSSSLLKPKPTKTANRRRSNGIISDMLRDKEAYPQWYAAVTSLNYINSSPSFLSEQKPMKVLFSDYAWPMKNPEHKPFLHQKETSKFLICNKRAFVFNDLGTGKTLAALWAADFLICNDKVKKILIVSPLSTMQSVWAREIFTNMPHRKYKIAHGSKEERTRIIRGDADFTIINHDGVTIMEDELCRQNWDIIIIDELTAFKKHTTKRSKAMQAICNRAKAVWGMSGAPTPNGPTEAFGQAKVVNPTNPHLPRYFKQFQYMVEQQVGPYQWIAKPDANRIVSQILQPAIRYKRDDCIDIPDCMYETLIVPFTPEQKKVYEQMKTELLVEYHSGLITASNAAVKMMKLLQIGAGSVKDDNGNSMKLDSTTRDEEVWRIFEETGKSKLVVFCAFTASIHHMVKFFSDRGVKVGAIHGSVDHKVRGELIRKFQDEDLQILVIQPQSSAHGITLTAANTIVWHSLIASGEIYVQANGRITRAGQTRKQFIFHIIGSQAEKRILSILQGKGDFSGSVLELFEEL